MSSRPVIFDMDGVLADSEAISSEITAQVLAEHGVTLSPEEIELRYVGRSTASIFKELVAEGRLASAGRLPELIRERTYAAYAERLAPVPGMDRLVLDHAFPRCVASSSAPLRIETTLRFIGLLDALQPHLFSSTMVENGKPAPDLFLLAAERMRWKPADCIVVEDSIAGVQAGVAAGMEVIALTAASHRQHGRDTPRLAAAGAAHIVESAAALAALLRRIGAQLLGRPRDH